MKIHIQPDKIKEYHMVRPEGVLSLNDMIRKMLTDALVLDVNDYNNDPGIQISNDKIPEVQVMYNKNYFNTKLFKYRSMTDLDVTHMVSLVNSEDDPDKWLQIFSTYVYPFIVDNKI